MRFVVWMAIFAAVMFAAISGLIYATNDGHYGPPCQDGWGLSDGSHNGWEHWSKHEWIRCIDGTAVAFRRTAP